MMFLQAHTGRSLWVWVVLCAPSPQSCVRNNSTSPPQTWCKGGSFHDMLWSWRAERRPQSHTRVSLYKEQTYADGGLDNATWRKCSTKVQVRGTVRAMPGKT